jgi:hypothetical protein
MQWSCPAVQYSSTLFHKWHYFGQNVIEQIVFSFPLQILSETYLLISHAHNGFESAPPTGVI